MAIPSLPDSTIPPQETITTSEIDRLQNEGVVSSWLFVVITIGLSSLTNTFTVYTLNRTESLQKNEILLYKALAINDIICAVSQSVAMVTAIGDIPASLREQRIIMMIYMCYNFILYNSLIIVVLINVNRFIMIMRPLHHVRLVTPKRLLCAMLLGILCMLTLVTLVYNLSIAPRVAKGSLPKITNISDFGPSLLLSSPILLGLFIIAITNCGNFYKSRQQARKIAQLHRNFLQKPEEYNPQGNHQAVAASGLKGLRTTGAITISYFVFWLPNFLNLSTIGELYRLPWFQPVLLSTLACISTWNPLIHCIANKPFRVASKKVMLQMKRACCGYFHQ